MTRATTTAAIVAGGQAMRFGGRDKSRLIVEGRSIIVRQVDVLQRVAAEILIVGGLADRFADLGLPVIADRQAGCGPIGGLATALDAARFDRAIVVACDLPFLEAALLERLAALAQPGLDGAWVRGPRGVEPLLACYRREARAAIQGEIEAGRLALQGLASVLHMAEIAGDQLRTFGALERLLANVNSPDDYARVQYPPA